MLPSWVSFGLHLLCRKPCSISWWYSPSLGAAGCWEPALDLCLWVLPLKTSPVCGACPTPTPCQTTAFTCVFRCFPCDPSCGSASWATPEFTPRSAAPMVKMTRSKTFQAYLPSCHRTYSCIHCRAHLANHDELISKVHVPCRPCLPTPGSRGVGAFLAHKVAQVYKLSRRTQDVCILVLFVCTDTLPGCLTQLRNNSEWQGGCTSLICNSGN